MLIYPISLGQEGQLRVFLKLYFIRPRGPCVCRVRVLLTVFCFSLVLDRFCGAGGSLCGGIDVSRG